MSDKTKRIYDSYRNLAKKINTKEGISLEGEFIDTTGTLENIIAIPVYDAFRSDIVSEDTGCLTAWGELQELMRLAIIEARREGESLISIKHGVVLCYQDYNAVTVDVSPLSKTYLEYGEINTVDGYALQRGEYIIVRTKAPLEFIRTYQRGYKIEEIVGDSLKRYLASLAMSTDILATLNQSVIKMEDLHQKLAQDKGEQDLMERLDVINHLKSNLSTILIDKEDEYVNVNKSSSGAGEIIKANALDLCSVSKIPYSRLFGQGSTGLSNSGEHDLRMYYDSVVGEIQENFVKVIFDSLTGFKYQGKYNFSPLYQASEEETSKNFERDVKSFKILYEMGVISEDTMKNRLKLDK
jgi:phage-related protein (TIGR01555 family)